MSGIIADRRMWWNAEKTQLYPEGHPQAAFLFCNEGEELTKEQVKASGYKTRSQEKDEAKEAAKATKDAQKKGDAAAKKEADKAAKAAKKADDKAKAKGDDKAQKKGSGK